jgi:uncharacterized tellurite resistance protein B-like protein
MPNSIQTWYNSLNDENTLFKVEDPVAFKEATAAILCNIINLKHVQKKDELHEFCDLFKSEFHLSDEDAQKIFDNSADIQSNIEKYTAIIKEQLDGDEYKMMAFMKMLNRFIIIDKCKEEDYCVFEKVKEQLFAS